jgi:hypothetical protein
VSEARERELHAMIDQTVNHWSGGSEPRWVPPCRPLYDWPEGPLEDRW